MLDLQDRGRSGLSPEWEAHEEGVIEEGGPPPGRVGGRQVSHAASCEVLSRDPLDSRLPVGHRLLT